jgi:hypothetical protein
VVVKQFSGAMLEVVGGGFVPIQIKLILQHLKRWRSTKCRWGVEMGEGGRW